MFFPIGDDQVKGGYRPIATYAFIAFNVVAFFIQITTPDAYICEFGTIPSDIRNGQGWITLITSMFMHGGWMHLIGNMLFLWVFADNIEATVGTIPFIAFYFLGGLAASALHIGLSGGEFIDGCCMVCGVQPCGTNAVICAGSVPSVGASGAISAVLGAYLVMFPKSKVKVLVLVIFRAFKVPAFIFLGFWIAQQLVSGFGAIGTTGSTGGTAWWAHIGGFIFGVLAGFAARKDVGGISSKPKKQMGELV